MKTLSKLFLGLTLIFVGTSLRAQNSSASTNDFYFESGEFNYYLDKSADGSSIMKVEETLTAVFPDFNQNHGIERCLVRSYNNVNTLDNPNFTVSRNGVFEPFSISSDGTYACLRIGSASSYVHGTQTYKISYTLENVILNPDNSESQELYWDVNGDGWAQSFNSLTATITLSDAIAPAWEKTAYCYIGKFGTSGNAATSRCKIEKDLDKNSITFSSLSAVLPNETMTIDLEFAPKSFAVKEPKKSYLLFFFAAGFLGLIVLGIVFWVKAENKVKEKKSLAKSKIISPEFTPMKNITPAEMAEIYLDPTGSSRVASLLDLAVKKHISLEKGEKKLFGKFKWKIHIKNIDHIPTEEGIVLKIINGGKEVKNDDIIEVKSHTATYSLEKLSKSFDTSVESSLKNKGLLETKNSLKSSPSSTAVAIIAFLIIFIFPFSISLFIGALETFSSSSGNIIYVGASYIIPGLFLGFFLYIFTAIIIAASLSKYKKRTLAGIKASKYMDGLKRYMTLAEKDRIKFLQSVSGADTSPAGIVKLYEKLLPYAVLFKLEDSWLKELNKYYEVEHIESNWATTGAIISASDFRSFTSYTSSSISSSTSYSSSSSGGGGGGGGGFSGGGGGGGGGGGW